MDEKEKFVRDMLGGEGRKPSIVEILSSMDGVTGIEVWYDVEINYKRRDAVLVIFSLAAVVYLVLKLRRR